MSNVENKKETDWNKILMTAKDNQIFWEIVLSKKGHDRHGDVGYFQLDESDCLLNVVIQDFKSKEIFEITLEEFYLRYDTSEKGEGIELTFAPEDKDHYYVIDGKFIDVFTKEEFTISELRDLINNHYGKTNEKLVLPMVYDEVNVDEVIRYFEDKFQDVISEIAILGTSPKAYITYDDDTENFVKLVSGLLTIRERMVIGYSNLVRRYSCIVSGLNMTELEVKAILDKHNITLE